MTHDPTLSNAGGAYVLHALEPEEVAAFEERMAADDELRAEVTSLADTAVELGLAIRAEDPGAALRARILAAAAELPQLPVDPPEPAAEPAPRAPVPISAARRRRPLTIAAAAAVMVVLALGGATIATVVSQNQHTSVTASQLAAIQSAADVHRAARPVVGGGTATVIWSPALKRSAVIVHDLPRLGSDRTYELWYIRAGGATAAGTFVPDADGGRSVVLSGALARGDLIGMTVEPSGGSSAPTSNPVLSVATS